MAISLLRRLGAAAGGANRGMQQNTENNLAKRKLKLLEDQEKKKAAAAEREKMDKITDEFISSVSKTISSIGAKDPAVMSGVPLTDEKIAELVAERDKLFNESPIPSILLTQPKYQENPELGKAKLEEMMGVLPDAVLKHQANQQKLKFEADKEKGKLEAREDFNKPTHIAVNRENPNETFSVLQTPTGPVRASDGTPLDESRFALSKIPSIEVGGAAELANKTRGTLEGSVVGNAESLATLQTIRDKFKPEFQELPTQLLMWGSKKFQRLGGKLSESQDKAFREYSSYRRSAFDALNKYIKFITGAQMSIKEAERILKAMPNPDTDSSSEFEQKIDDVIKEGKLSTARSIYMLRNGIQHDFNDREAEPPVSVDDMEFIIDSRGEEIMNELKANSGITDEAKLFGLTQNQLKSEFGL